jgi:transcriptional repressor NrdR
MVKKKGGTFEPFDRNKLSRGIFSALKKRPIESSKVDEIIDYIESTCENAMRTQITSTKIGDMVMDKLKYIDQVAYVRFASVYKEFDSVNGFIDVISELSAKD